MVLGKSGQATPSTPNTVLNKRQAAIDGDGDDTSDDDGVTETEGDFIEQVAIPPSLRCGIVIHRLQDGFAGRTNTISNYVELNRQVRCPLLDTEETNPRGVT